MSQTPSRERLRVHHASRHFAHTAVTPLVRGIGQSVKRTWSQIVLIGAGRQRVLALAVLSVCFCRGAAGQESEEFEAEFGSSGIVVEWSDARHRVASVVARPCFRLTRQASVHPLIDQQRFAARWSGQLHVLRPGSYRFFADVVGRVELRINGTTVLAAIDSADVGRSSPVSKPVELAYGLVPIEVRYEKRKAGPATIQLDWQREGDFREPVPPQAFRHFRENSPSTLSEWNAVNEGRRLAARYQCALCHAAPGEQLAAWDIRPRPGPSLVGIGDRLQEAWIYHWLRRPHEFRPTTSMPALFAEDSPTERIDLYAATKYLAGLQEHGDGSQSSVSKKRPKSPDASETRGRESFARTGCIACHLAVDEDSADDRHARMVAPLPPLRRTTGLGSKMTADTLASYLTEPVKHWPETLMPTFDFSVHSEKNDLDAIVSYLIASRDERFESMPPTPERAPVERYGEFVQDAARVAEFSRLNVQSQWVSLGREVVRQRNCAACHLFPGGERTSPPAPCFGELFGRGAGAVPSTADFVVCRLAGVDREPFGFTKSQREHLATFLTTVTESPASNHAPLVKTRWRMDRLGCTACHQRDGRGGRFARRILDFVPLETDQTLLDLAPPTLTAVGEKLQPEWLRGVIERGDRARPWLPLQMPKFAPEAIEGLAEGLIAADGLPASDANVSQVAVDAESREAGRQLVGRFGFNCVSCHDIRGRTGTGTRGPDLAGVTRRVRREWFDRWLLDPQRITPGTRMPTVFFGGKSAAPKWLGGDPHLQIAALWDYLSLGDQLPLPPMQAPTSSAVAEGENPTFMPKDRPLLVRGFMVGHAGLRGIAVGFPAGLHFAFDSERCELMSVWKGDFVYRGGWTGRGRGTAEEDGLHVLGEIIWRAEPGSWRVGKIGGSNASPESGGDRTAGSAEVWPPSEVPSVRFLGCWTTDDRPGFAYALRGRDEGSLTIEERVRPESVGEFDGFTRCFRVVESQSGDGLWLRLASSVASLRMRQVEGDIVAEHPRRSSLGERITPAAWRVADSCLEFELDDGRRYVLRASAPPASRWVVATGDDADAESSTAGVWLHVPFESDSADRDRFAIWCVALNEGQDADIDKLSEFEIDCD